MAGNSQTAATTLAVELYGTLASVAAAAPGGRTAEALAAVECWRALMVVKTTSWPMALPSPPAMTLIRRPCR
jgi:hypothetical protein